MKNKKVLYSIIPALFANSALFADASGAASQGNLPRTLAFFGIVLVFFYVILWRPEQKRRKKMQTQRDSLKVGDKVTAMGIVGTIHNLDSDNTAILKMVDGSKIEVLKAAISEIHQPVVVEEKVANKNTEEAPAKA